MSLCLVTLVRITTCEIGRCLFMHNGGATIVISLFQTIWFCADDFIFRCYQSVKVIMCVTYGDIFYGWLIAKFYLLSLAAAQAWLVFSMQCFSVHVDIPAVNKSIVLYCIYLQWVCVGVPMFPALQRWIRTGC